jgi:hypothetical protein
MRAKAMVTMVVAMVGGLGIGWYEHKRAERAERAIVEQRRALPKLCRQHGVEALARAMHTAAGTRRSAMFDEETEPTSGEATDTTSDLADAEQLTPFDESALDEWTHPGVSSGSLPRDLATKLSLSSEQEEILRAQVSTMNERVAHAVENLIDLMAKDDARPREAIDVLAAGLAALRDADDTFRAALDERQRAALETESFDITSAVDMEALLPILALSMPADMFP